MLINKIELRHLRTLKALRDTKSLRGAADEVCLTQSALSHQIKDLEERLGCELLSRRMKPIQFSGAGLRMLELADEVIPLVRNAAIDVARFAGGSTGRLYLAVECHSCLDWLLPALSAYRAEWTDVDLDISSGFHFQPLPALVRGDLDLVITSDPLPDLDLVYEPLFKYEAKLGVGVSHSLAKRKKGYVEPSDIRKETLVTYPIENDRLDIFKKFLTPAEIQPQGIRHCELTTMIIHQVANGRGVACLPNWAMQEYIDKKYVVTKSLGRNGVWSTLYAAVRKDRAELNYMKAFFAIARSTCFQTLPGVKRVRQDQSPELQRTANGSEH